MNKLTTIVTIKFIQKKSLKVKEVIIKGSEMMLFILDEDYHTADIIICIKL